MKVKIGGVSGLGSVACVAALSCRHYPPLVIVSGTTSCHEAAGIIHESQTQYRSLPTHNDDTCNKTCPNEPVQLV